MLFYLRRYGFYLACSYGQLEINTVFALVAFAEQIMALNNTTQQQKLLEKLHTQFHLQLPVVPQFKLCGLNPAAWIAAMFKRLIIGFN